MVSHRYDEVLTAAQEAISEVNDVAPVHYDEQGNPEGGTPWWANNKYHETIAVVWYDEEDQFHTKPYRP